VARLRKENGPEEHTTHLINSRPRTEYFLSAPFVRSPVTLEFSHVGRAVS
jgi:hypothetical protein